MPIFLTKTSGVVAISQDSGQPKYYFTFRGKFTVGSNNTTIFLEINEDSYQFEYTDIRVNGQTPSTITTAATLLNALLGT